MGFRVKLNYYYYDFEDVNEATDFMITAKNHYTDKDGDGDLKVQLEIIEAPTGDADEASKE